MMTVALPVADLPALVREALSRTPRRTAAKPRVPADPENGHDNYRAEAAPNWGRNRKGAGAPPGNRNAHLHGVTRMQIRLARLMARLKMQRYQLMVLRAAVEYVETRPAARPGEAVPQN